MSLKNIILEIKKDDDLNYWTGFEENDYKEKLRRLRQRRDPEGIEENHPKRKSHEERIDEEQAHVDSNILSSLRKSGYKIEKLYDEDLKGSGGTSSVYRIDNKKVLKIGSENYAEVREYEKLIGKNTKHIADIKYAKWYPESKKGVVVMESLFQSDLDFIIDTDFFYPSDFTAGLMDFYKYAESPTDMLNRFLIFFYKNFKRKEIDKSDFINNGMEKELEKYVSQMYKGFGELKNHNVVFNDVHNDNVMMDRQSNYKIIDFYY